MKRLSTIIMALAVVFGMTQCTKPATKLYDGTYTGVTKEITFSTGGSSKVEIENVLNELKFRWQDTDHLYVYGSANNPFSGGEYCGSLALVKGAGTENGFFSGTLNNVPTSGTLRFYYCAEGLFDELTRTIAVDLSEQDGSLPGIASKLVAYADVAVKPDGGDYSATLAVPYSVVKLDLHEFGTTDITMTGTTKQCVTISGNGECTFTAAATPETTLSGAGVGANTYISVIPESGSTTLSFEGDNGIVGSWAINLESNTFQTLNNGGDPVPVLPVETDEWINFNDPAMGVEGLPIWSKYNLGANVDRILNDFEHAVATDWYGDYYAWGEIEPYYADGHAYDDMCTNWRTMTTGDGNTDVTNGYRWITYCAKKHEFISDCFFEWTNPPYGPDNILKAERDAATQNIAGGEWRTPTGSECGGTSDWCSLISNTYCKYEYNYKGIEGLSGFVVYKVKHTADKGLNTLDRNWLTDFDHGETPHWVTYNEDYEQIEPTGLYNYENDPHMFLPAGGRRDRCYIAECNRNLYYWSSSFVPEQVYGEEAYCYITHLSNEVFLHTNNDYRYVGYLVRPVR